MSSYLCRFEPDLFACRLLTDGNLAMDLLNLLSSGGDSSEESLTLALTVSRMFLIVCLWLVFSSAAESE